MSLYGLSLDTVVRRTAALGSGPNSSAENALSAIAKYIPSEAVAIYLLGIALTRDEGTRSYFLSPVGLYLALLVATPVIFVLIFIAQFRAAQPDRQRPRWSDVPRWRLFAAALAFAVWALAVPENGLVDQGGTMLAAFGAVVVSTGLTLVEKAFE